MEENDQQAPSDELKMLLAVMRADKLNDQRLTSICNTQYAQLDPTIRNCIGKMNPPVKDEELIQKLTGQCVDYVWKLACAETATMTNNGSRALFNGPLTPGDTTHRNPISTTVTEAGKDQPFSKDIAAAFDSQPQPQQLQVVDNKAAQSKKGAGSTMAKTLCFKEYLEVDRATNQMLVYGEQGKQNMEDLQKALKRTGFCDGQCVVGLISTKIKNMRKLDERSKQEQKKAEDDSETFKRTGHEKKYVGPLAILSSCCNIGLLSMSSSMAFTVLAVSRRARRVAFLFSSPGKLDSPRPRLTSISCMATDASSVPLLRPRNPFCERPVRAPYPSTWIAPLSGEIFGLFGIFMSYRVSLHNL